MVLVTADHMESSRGDRPSLRSQTVLWRQTLSTNLTLARLSAGKSVRGWDFTGVLVRIWSLSKSALSKADPLLIRFCPGNDV